MTDSSWDDSGLSERASQRHRRAVGLIALAAVVLGSASVTYLSSTGALHLGAFLAATSHAPTRSPAENGLQRGGGFAVDPTAPAGTSVPRTAGLVGPGAISVLIEQFGGLNDQPPLGLKAWVRVSDSAVISKLVRELNALPAMPSGFFSCPQDDGSYFVLAFTYARGTFTNVNVEASGCGQVFVGDLAQPAAWTLTSPAFLDSLRGLLAHPPA